MSASQQVASKVTTPCTYADSKNYWAPLADADEEYDTVHQELAQLITINNSGAQSGTATGIYLRATETTLNSMAHNFIDLGTIALGSLFSVTNKGAIKVASLANADAPNSSLYFSTDASRLVWKDAGGTVNNLY